MIVAYMIVYFIYILLSNSCQGTIVKKPAFPYNQGTRAFLHFASVLFIHICELLRLVALTKRLS